MSDFGLTLDTSPPGEFTPQWASWDSNPDLGEQGMCRNSDSELSALCPLSYRPATETPDQATIPVASRTQHR